MCLWLKDQYDPDEVLQMDYKMLMSLNRNHQSIRYRYPEVVQSQVGELSRWRWNMILTQPR